MERTAPQKPSAPPRREPSPTEHDKDDAQLDHELEQTFPASDPVPPKHVD